MKPRPSKLYIAWGVGRSVIHDAAGFGRVKIRNAAGIVGFLVRIARTGNTASEVVVVKQVCGAVYGGPYLVADVLGASGPS